mmetsp:Transcript_6934/g.7193  ORF Transcript_6934/g.7193 Transcript_6934/m.7193 type:complete len:159 (+) Transcript_6934:3-479(+)
MAIKYYSKNNNFHPLFIVSNIGLLLSFMFIVRYITTLLIDSVSGLRFHKEQILGSSQFSFDSSYTYAAIISSSFESVIMIAAFVLVIEKANKILDYVATNFCFELFLIWFYCGFPFALSFWVFTAIRISSITIIAEFIALKIEQQEISINTNFISGTI